MINPLQKYLEKETGLSGWSFSWGKTDRVIKSKKMIKLNAAKAVNRPIKELKKLINEAISRK